VVPYWLSGVVIAEAFGEEVSGRSHDHIVRHFTNLLLTESLEENGQDAFPRHKAWVLLTL
jgi:hypothetical protein